MAPSAAAAFTTLFGLRAWECLSEDIGFYHCAPHLLPRLIAVAASHRACGVFVVPAHDDDIDITCDPGGNADAPAMTSPLHFESKSKGGQRQSTPWRAFLRERTAFTFRLPVDAFAPAYRGPVVAVLANFGTNIHLVRKRRQEIQRGHVDLVCQSRHHGGTRLGPVPTLLHRVSTVPFEPSPSEDVIPAAAPSDVPVPAEPTRPSPAPISPEWPVAAFAEMCADFPCPQTFEHAINVMSG